MTREEESKADLRATEKVVALKVSEKGYWPKGGGKRWRLPGDVC